MANDVELGGLSLAISDRMVVATVNRGERCVQLYGAETGDSGVIWTNRKLTAGLVRPYGVAFAPNNHLVITDTGDNTIKIYNVEEDLRLVKRLRHLRINGPKNVVVGPGPLSPMFVVCGNELLLINMDWKTVTITSFFPISSPVHWQEAQFNSRIICENLSIVSDHKDSHKVGGQNPLALTTAQFCAMFYHVTRCNAIRYSCLESSECRVGKEGNKMGFSATVVVYVRLTDKRGRLIFHARYGNCYQGPFGNTIHAEYFMLMDAEFRQAVDLLRSNKGGNIDIYMNKQPCYRSTGNTRMMFNALKIKECASDLVEFHNQHCLPYDIKFAINLCQLYKVDMRSSENTRNLAEDIRNAKCGMEMMMTAGIELRSMTGESWKQLAEYAHVKLPEYQASSRQELDQHVATFLETFKAQHSCSSQNVSAKANALGKGARANEPDIRRSLMRKINKGKKIVEDKVKVDVPSAARVVVSAVNGSSASPLVSEDLNPREATKIGTQEATVEGTQDLEEDFVVDDNRRECSEPKRKIKQTSTKPTASLVNPASSETIPDRRESKNSSMSSSGLSVANSTQVLPTRRLEAENQKLEPKMKQKSITAAQRIRPRHTQSPTTSELSKEVGPSKQVSNACLPPSSANSAPLSTRQCFQARRKKTKTKTKKQPKISQKGPPSAKPAAPCTKTASSNNTTSKVHVVPTVNVLRDSFKAKKQNPPIAKSKTL